MFIDLETCDSRNDSVFGILLSQILDVRMTVEGSGHRTTTKRLRFLPQLDAVCSSPQFEKLSCLQSMQWVPVTTAWRVLRLRIEERQPIRRVAANKLNKQLRTVDEGWSSSLGVGRVANNPSL